MADLVKYELDDGSTGYFRVRRGQPRLPRGGELYSIDADKLGDRLQQVAKAAGPVADSMRSTLVAEEMQLQFGVKTGEAGFWFSSPRSAAKARSR